LLFQRNMKRHSASGMKGNSAGAAGGESPSQKQPDHGQGLLPHPFFVGAGGYVPPTASYAEHPANFSPQVQQQPLMPYYAAAPVEGYHAYYGAFYSQSTQYPAYASLTAPPPPEDKLAKLPAWLRAAVKDTAQKVLGKRESKKLETPSTQPPLAKKTSVSISALLEEDEEEGTKEEQSAYYQIPAPEPPVLSPNSVGSPCGEINDLNDLPTVFVMNAIKYEITDILKAVTNEILKETVEDVFLEALRTKESKINPSVPASGVTAPDQTETLKMLGLDEYLNEDPSDLSPEREVKHTAEQQDPTDGGNPERGWSPNRVQNQSRSRSRERKRQKTDVSPQVMRKRDVAACPQRQQQS